MKIVDIKKLKEELNKYCSSDAKKTIIINNAELYNDLIRNYKANKNQNNLYIIYQLNGMIIKQMNELEKSSQNEELEDEFVQTIKSISAQQDKKKPIGYAVVNKDTEKRNVE